MRTSKAKEFGRQMAYFARQLPSLEIDTLIHLAVYAEQYCRADERSRVRPLTHGQVREAALCRLGRYCDARNLKLTFKGGRPYIKRRRLDVIIPVEMYCVGD